MNANENHMPQRKRNRLMNYDYSRNNAYFITVCAKDRACLFGTVGAAICRPNNVILSELGGFVDDAIQKIHEVYSTVLVESYVIMPNHIHLIVSIGRDADVVGAAICRQSPTVSLIIGNMKRAVSIRAGFCPWQKSFHDHIIRDGVDYNRIADYVVNNPAT